MKPRVEENINNKITPGKSARDIVIKVRLDTAVIPNTISVLGTAYGLLETNMLRVIAPNRPNSNWHPPTIETYPSEKLNGLNNWLDNDA